MRFEKKKIQKAAALEYHPAKDVSPRVTALGKGIIAKKIIETAKKANVPVYHDEKLIDTLNQLKIGDRIPQELYEVVAEMLVYIATIDKAYGEKYVGYR